MEQSKTFKILLTFLMQLTAVAGLDLRVKRETQCILYFIGLLFVHSAHLKYTRLKKKLLLLLIVEFNVIKAYPSLKAGSSSSRTHQSLRREIPCTSTLLK